MAKCKAYYGISSRLGVHHECVRQMPPFTTLRSQKTLTENMQHCKSQKCHVEIGEVLHDTAIFLNQVDILQLITSVVIVTQVAYLFCLCLRIS